MTLANYTHYILITDHSGSMWSIQKDATGGIRSFLKEQDALPGKATLSFYEFDTKVTLLHDFAHLTAAKNYTLIPAGGTAFLDAVGIALTEQGEKLAALPEDERPDKVVVLMTTDGEENRSTEWTLDAVKALVVQQQEQYGWAFSYAAANLDAVAEAAKIGIPGASTVAFAATGQGVSESYTRMSKSTTQFRSGLTKGVVYDDKS